MKILILNGPNLNMVGIREKDIYGELSFEEMNQKILSFGKENNIDLSFYQSNHEGDLIDQIQNAYFEKYDGVVFNPGGYTHTSIALADAIKAIDPIPVVEVHISDVNNREDYRKISYIEQNCIAKITGLGVNSYIEGIKKIIEVEK